MKMDLIKFGIIVEKILLIQCKTCMIYDEKYKIKISIFHKESLGTKIFIKVKI